MTASEYSGCQIEGRKTTFLRSVQTTSASLLHSYRVVERVQRRNGCIFTPELKPKSQASHYILLRERVPHKERAWYLLL